jgi:hypothetical protein
MDIPLMIGYDGMKVLFPISMISKIAISTSIISLNPPIVSLDFSIIIHLIIINIDNIEFHKIIDMEINEKYRYNDIDKRIKLSENNPYNIDSELSHYQSNIQLISSII